MTASAILVELCKRVKLVRIVISTWILIVFLCLCCCITQHILYILPRLCQNDLILKICLKIRYFFNIYSSFQCELQCTLLSLVELELLNRLLLLKNKELTVQIRLYIILSLILWIGCHRGHTSISCSCMWLEVIYFVIFFFFKITFTHIILFLFLFLFCLNLRDANSSMGFEAALDNFTMNFTIIIRTNVAEQ